MYSVISGLFTKAVLVTALATTIVSGGATVEETADRMENRIQVTDTLPPPVYPGLQGKPYAPTELSGCAELEFYRVQWDLPEIFGGERWQMGWKESNCRNDVENSCCHGYWQLHERYWSHIPECEVYNIYDLQGTTALSKQKNACAAAVVYAESGCSAWSTCPY